MLAVTESGKSIVEANCSARPQGRKRVSMQIVEHQAWTRERERQLRDYAEAPRYHGSIPKFSMAFQPIVDVAAGHVFAYEALVRSVKGEGAHSVISRVSRKHFNSFDLACRSWALRAAMEAGLLQKSVGLCINMNPNAGAAEKTSLRRTCEYAEELGFPLNRLIFEFVEDEQISSLTGLQRMIAEYRERGVRVAIDDFGAGYSGLKLLSRLQPDIVKIDMELVSRVDADRPTQVILRAIVQACRELNIEVVAEGVERNETATQLRDMGIVLQQGYYFAKPIFEGLPAFDFCLPELSNS